MNGMYFRCYIWTIKQDVRDSILEKIAHDKKNDLFSLSLGIIKEE